MKIRITTKLLVVLIITAFAPLLILGWFGYQSTIGIREIASQANRDVAELAMSDSSAALSAELKTRLLHLTERHAGDVDEILLKVQGDTVKLADFAGYLFNHGEGMGRYAFPTQYEPAPEKRMFGSRRPNPNSWLGAFGESVDAEGRVNAETLAEIQVTEYMDILFRSVAATNPYAVQLYLNTARQISRGMPFVDGRFQWVDATEHFSHVTDVSAFDFYYLADAAHNPERRPQWTELYWDPAGLGWMVSSIAPVYRGDELAAVAGIDITLARIVEGILGLQVEQTGFAFLMSDRGQAIAFPERATEFLEFRGSFQGEFKANESFEHLLTEVRDPDFRTIIDRMRQGEADLITYTDPKDGQDYFFAYHPIPVTGWSVGIVVPVQEVIAPALATNQKIEQSRALTDAELNARADDLVRTFLWLLFGIMATLIPVALVFARSISKPIQALAEGSRRVGAGELGYRIQVDSGDEIQDLALTFNQMAEDLKNKIDEIETANQELQQLDQLKSKFISMASHELRTPLIAIQGYVDLIREGRGGEIAESQRAMLDIVSRNATRLARIVSELLDISRIEENKLVLERVPVSLGQIVSEIAEEQQPYLESRGHSLSLEIAETLPLVDGDPDRISQVVINLLGNAIKYTPDGGRIHIRVSAEPEGVHLEVRDTGIGIKAEDLGKLFKRFSTLGDVTKHRTGKNEFLAGGTGLGLSIVQGIVQAHEGKIWVESEYGQGSTFHVLWPIAHGVDPETERRPARTQRSEDDLSVAPAFKVIHFEHSAAAPIEAAPDAPLSILVVDDEPDVITFTRDLLEDRYQVFSAQTGALAIKEAIGCRPHLVLLDAWMPGISGYDVCRTLKRNSHTRDMPIIIFTAATQKIDEERARESGADGFVTKPFRREQIIELIESFRGHQA
jgi:two-component system, sensor histidine kinase ChiS